MRHPSDWFTGPWASEAQRWWVVPNAETGAGCVWKARPAPVLGFMTSSATDRLFSDVACGHRSGDGNFACAWVMHCSSDDLAVGEIGVNPTGRRQFSSSGRRDSGDAGDGQPEQQIS